MKKCGKGGRKKQSYPFHSGKKKVRPVTAARGEKYGRGEKNGEPPFPFQKKEWEIT